VSAAWQFESTETLRSGRFPHSWVFSFLFLFRYRRGRESFSSALLSACTRFPCYRPPDPEGRKERAALPSLPHNQTRRVVLLRASSRGSKPAADSIGRRGRVRRDAHTAFQSVGEFLHISIHSPPRSTTLFISCSPPVGAQNLSRTPVPTFPWSFPFSLVFSSTRRQRVRKTVF